MTHRSTSIALPTPSRTSPPDTASWLCADSVLEVETAYQTCYRHPDQQAGVICQRCDRPICPRCMHQASVGFHCPECTKQGAQKVFQGIGSLRVPPVFTQAIIAINVAIFILGILLAGADGATGRGLTEMQRDYGLWAGGIWNGELYRLVTSGFLHAGIIHLGFNMWILWVFGQAVEQMGGKGKSAAIYFLAMFAGGLGALILSPGSLTVGASGAIFGLAGAVLVGQRAMGVPIRNSPLLGFLVLNAVITLTFSGTISAGGHLGGFIGGALAGWLFFDLGAKRTTPSWVPWAVSGVVVVALVVASVVVSNSWVNSQIGF